MSKSLINVLFTWERILFSLYVMSIQTLRPYTFTLGLLDNVVVRTISRTGVLYIHVSFLCLSQIGCIYKWIIRVLMRFKSLFLLFVAVFIALFLRLLHALFQFDILVSSFSKWGKPWINNILLPISIIFSLILELFKAWRWYSIHPSDIFMSIWPMSITIMHNIVVNRWF